MHTRLRVRSHEPTSHAVKGLCTHTRLWILRVCLLLDLLSSRHCPRVTPTSCKCRRCLRHAQDYMSTSPSIRRSTGRGCVVGGIWQARHAGWRNTDLIHTYNMTVIHTYIVTVTHAYDVTGTHAQDTYGKTSACTHTHICTHDTTVTHHQSSTRAPRQLTRNRRLNCPPHMATHMHTRTRTHTLTPGARLQSPFSTTHIAHTRTHTHTHTHKPAAPEDSAYTTTAVAVIAPERV